ncbi:hypothetical protein FOZ61_008852 [Perkinsus olseni]|uniref:Uncharacterized protein n=1 Tax=Perkinsus olseni TaxID=32597 RepID=A0A7J6L228_PEROL|nr:hypothetical protein FOZ61_008852 [Perkinsus olseni]
MPPPPAEKKSTLSLTRERLLAKFGKSKESVIDPVLKSYNGRAIDLTEYRKIENLVANTIRDARRKGGRNAIEDATAAARAAVSDVSSRNDPRLKPVVELPKQRPFHLQKMQAASAGKTMNAAGQYDLIVQYDSYMHAVEEKDRLQSEKQKKEEYRKALDSQMMAKRAGMANEAQKREEERLAMLGAKEEFKRDSERRATRMKQKKLAMIQEADEAQRSIQRRRRREMAEREAERQESLQRMQRETAEAAMEERKRKAANDKRLNEINENIKDAIERKRRARQEEAELAEILAKQQAGTQPHSPTRGSHLALPQIAAAEANEKAKADALERLSNRIKQIAQTIGKSVGDENKRREEEEDRRLQAHLHAAELASRKAEADKRARQEKAKRDMLDMLSQQVQEKMQLRRFEDTVNKRQGEEYRKMAIAALEDEVEEHRQRRRRRADMDKELEKQICFTNLTTEEDRMEVDLQRRELELNQPLFRRMAAQRYKEKECAKLLLSQKADST